MSLQFLSDETLLRILSYLPCHTDAAALSLQCHRWHRLVYWGVGVRGTKLARACGLYVFQCFLVGESWPGVGAGVRRGLPNAVFFHVAIGAKLGFGHLIVELHVGEAINDF